MRPLNDPFTLVASVLVIIGAITMFVVVMRMNTAWKRADWTDDNDRAMLRRRSRQLNIGGGLFQITIGLLLISMGNIVNSIGVLGMGIILILAAHYGLLTGEWWERRRPGRD